ncbi:MAG: ATP synthase F0 subunit B [Myxococcales bacterium]|nr:ATP synthase F0 subunit B [Myxococcales bacterium]
MRSFLVASSCAALIFVGAGVLPASVALASDTPDVEDPHAKGAHGGSASGAHGGAHGGEHKGPPKHINWFSLDYGKGKKHANPPIGWAIVNFIILLYLLYRFGAKPFSAYLRRRSEETKKALEEAKELRRRAQERLAEIEGKLAGLDDEIARIRKDVAADAERERDAIIARAEQEAERMIENADRTIEEEVNRARHRLESQVVSAAVAAAEKLLLEKATEADRTRLDEEFLSDFAGSAESATSTSPSGGSN